MTRSFGDDHARQIREALSDPYKVAEALGIERSRKERGKWLCPAHGGSSLSLRRARDGALQVKCFGCDLAGDVFTLIAAARGMNVKGDFKALLAEGAELAGLWNVVNELRDPKAPRIQRPKPAPIQRTKPVSEEPDYPPLGEVHALWEAGIAPTLDVEVSAMLSKRGYEVARVEGRALPKDAALPKWARYGGRTWIETGHRFILPVFDAFGVMRSVRAWRVLDNDTPKRLPPTGHKASGLVLANEIAREMLAGNYVASRVLILEGEPDFLTWAAQPARFAVTAMLGIVSGAWTDEIAARIHSGARVTVRTHHDPSGDKYAAAINETLRDRCKVLRPKAEHGRQ